MGGLGFLTGGKAPVPPLTGAPPVLAKAERTPDYGGGGGDAWASMKVAAQVVDNSGGKTPLLLLP
jgi:hypothetical protein